jgi:hypothetical protein
MRSLKFAMAERYDPRDVQLSRVLIVVGGSVLVVALFLIGIRWFLGSNGPVVAAPGTKQPPSPPLSVSLPAERAQLQAAAETDLHRLAWIDREKGIARIPIDDAIKLFVVRGWPP